MNKAKRNKLLILLVLLIIVSIVAFAISKMEEKKEQIKNTDEIILSIDSDSVEKLSWTYDDTSLSFQKSGSWNWDEDSAFPVDDEKIAKLLSDFENFGAAFAIDDVTNFSQYGLSNPAAVITITTSDKEYTISLGDESKMDQKRYVSIGDGKVYLVTNDPLSDFQVSISDLIKDDEIPDFEEVSAISFAGKYSYIANYEEDSNKSWCDEDVYFVGNKPLDTEKVSDFLATLSNLTLSTYMTYDATEEELAKYGLDSDELTITVDDFVLHVGGVDSESTSDTPPAYIRVGDSKIIYQISYTSYQALIACGYNDLRHDEVLTVDYDDIIEYQFTLDGQTYIVSSYETEDSTKWTYGDNDEVDLADIRTAFDVLNAVEFTDEKPSKELEIGITIATTLEKYSTIQINIYRYDGDNCLVQINNESFALVSRDEVVDLIEAVHKIVL